MPVTYDQVSGPNAAPHVDEGVGPAPEVSSSGIVSALAARLRECWRRQRRWCRRLIVAPKELLVVVGVTTTALMGGGLIFGFAPFAARITRLPDTKFTNQNVSSIFAIGHHITAWGCCLSGLVLDKFGPRFCTVTGLLIEALGHCLLVDPSSNSIVLTTVAYGLIGLGGCQVLLGALAFVDAFKYAAIMNAMTTAAFQLGGFIFIALSYLDWKVFFTYYMWACVATAVVVFLLYPDQPLPSYSDGHEQSDIASLSNAMANSRSFKQILMRPGSVWFLITFMVAGSALIYGQGEFVSAIASKDDCDWDDTTGDFVDCQYQSEQDLMNGILMPIVGNFILPMSLILGWLIDHKGFAVPAIINVASVQAFIAALWLIPLEGQYATLVIYNIANAAVFTIQNAYICAVGRSHIGAFFGVSNFVMGLGNIVSDWLSLNPFGSKQIAVHESLMISSIAWLVITCPLYWWAVVELGSARRREEGLQSLIESGNTRSNSRSLVTTPPKSARESWRSASNSESLHGERARASRAQPLLEPVAIQEQLREDGQGRSMDSTIRVTSSMSIVPADEARWEAKVRQVLAAGAKNTFLVLDFDRTITKCFLESGDRALDSHDILASIPKITEECKKNMEMLVGKYYPIEIDPQMSKDEKIPHMLEWYGLVHDMLTDQGLTKADMAAAVAGCEDFRLREGIAEVFQVAQARGIPIVIVSAGLGNIIEEVLRQCIPKASGSTGEPWGNVAVLSNTLLWDEEGRHVAFSEPLIHMFNKSLEDAPGRIRHLLGERHVGVLCGDGMGDLTMAKGHKTSVLLKLGFLNERINDRVRDYTREDAYDRVVVNDGTFECLLEVLRLLR